jgi:beta-lactamase regulating signal transducer with metallopeptidase domain
MKACLLSWLFANAAIGGGLLTLGCVLAARCQRPVLRLRLMEWTLVAALVAPLLASIQGPWTLALRWLPARPAPAEPTAMASVPANADFGNRPNAPQLPAVAARGRKTEAQTAAAPVASPAAPQPFSESTEPASGFRNWFDWREVVLGIEATAVALLAARWLVGVLALARVWSNAQPVSAALAAQIAEQIDEQIDAQIRGRSRRSVDVRVHIGATSPSLFGLFRPRILLPEFLTRDDQAHQLRFALAHELSHLERGDLWSWRLVRAAQFALWFQPAYWWLRHQARLCQDYLADFEAATVGEPADLAAFLLELTRIGQSMPAVAALSMRSHPPDITRRITMLLKPDARLDSRCPRRFQALAGCAVLAIIATAAIVRLAAQDVAKPNKPETAASKPQGSEALTYHGTVVDAGTKTPIAGATVVVRRSLLGDPRYPNVDKVLQETRHTTDAAGGYSFTLPPEQAAERYLYIELDVSHSDYAPRNGFGYALSMIRKNEKLGGEPFFANTKLYPAKTITGTVVTPDGKPAANVPISGYTYPGGKPYLQEAGEFGLTITGSFEKSSTDNQGRFRIVVATPGRGGFWLKPADYAPLGFVAPDKRGDVGTLRLNPGWRTKGQVLDSDGKPVPGMEVSVNRRDAESPDVDAFNQGSMAVGGYERSAKTDAEGRFQLAPLGPGKYEFRIEHNLRAGAAPKYAGAFLQQILTLTKDEDDLKLRAVPTVEIHVKNVNSKGKPSRGFEFHVFGRLDSSVFFSGQSDRPESGLSTAKVPKGLRNVELRFMENEHGSLRVRRSPGATPENTHEVKINKIDADLAGIEVIRYKAPIVMVKAVDAQGHVIPGFEATGTYVTPHPQKDQPHESFEKQPDGRWRSTSLLPDMDLTIGVKAPRWKADSRTVKLREGEVREVAFSMVRE